MALGHDALSTHGVLQGKRIKRYCLGLLLVVNHHVFTDDATGDSERRLGPGQISWAIGSTSAKREIILLRAEAGSSGPWRNTIMAERPSYMQGLKYQMVRQGDDDCSHQKHDHEQEHNDTLAKIKVDQLLYSGPRYILPERIPCTACYI